MGKLDSLSILSFSPVQSRSTADADGWRKFVAASAGGCLFHELDFLAYHPEGRFNFEHLVAEQAGRIVAVLPGGPVEREGRQVYRSPLGASFGGPVLPEKARAGDVIELLQRLQDFARTRGWQSIELTPPPAIYRRDRSDVLDFALQSTGFRLATRLLCHALPLDRAAGAEAFAGLFRGKNARRARAALKAGVETVLGGTELLDHFRVVFDETYARHGVAATHSIEEISDLIVRLPDRFRFAVARLQDAPLGGLFLMQMSPRVANAFYICNSTRNPETDAGLAMFATTIAALAAEGTEILDLGPSSLESGEVNSGVAYFKESLGAFAYCRDRWTWSTTA